jgi:hypothetical protein
MAHKRRRRRTKPASLEQFADVLWRVVLEIEELLSDEECPPERVLRAGHCLAQMSGAYRALMETVELEQRVRALELAAGRER